MASASQPDRSSAANAMAAFRAGRHGAALADAEHAIARDPGDGLAWRVLALCREQAGELAAALKACEQALMLAPQEPEIVNDLGRVSLRLGQPGVAEQFFAHYLTMKPGSVEGLNNLACAQREQMHFAEATETLRGALDANPASALLWNGLGAILAQEGRVDEALVFYDEAARLAPDQGSILCNRSHARLAAGDGAGALADLTAAEAMVSQGMERAGVRVAKAKALLATGALEAGWAAYAARLDAQYEDVTRFVVNLPAWTPSTGLDGLRLLLIGEQGLGDEVMFSSVLPEVQNAVGAAGALALAVDPRLVDLFRRAFPGIEVGAHASARIGHVNVRRAPFADGRDGQFDAYAPLGDLLAPFRSRVDQFTARAFLRADPARVAHWRAVLAEHPGRKVGLLWKSLVMSADRVRHFAPFDAWRPVLQVCGATFVDLQYGRSEAETEIARGWGVNLWTPPGIDLKDDLDDLAALTTALDLTLGPPNATTNIAAACGARVWLITAPYAWTQLGRADYPWYPQARVFTPPACGRWDETMAAVSAALAAEA
jgi:Flp pilus assembly protein TadD